MQARPVHVPNPLAPANRMVRVKKDVKAASREKKRKVQSLEDEEFEGMSYLQRQAVRSGTREAYLAHWRRFLSWAQHHGMQLGTRDALEEGMLEFFDFLYFEGEDANTGQKTFSAALFFRPQWGRQQQGSLQRIKQALRGWTRLTPSRSRLPTPWEVVCLLAWDLVRADLWSMAAAVLMCVVFYFRPSEALDLRVCQVVPPLHARGPHSRWTIIMHPMELGTPSKTDQWDDSRLLDLKDHAFRAPVLSRLVARRRPEERLFGFDYGEWRLRYREAGLRQQLQDLGPPTLYCLRHAGASLDVALNRRSLAAVQQRGNWLSAQSVRRYQKAGRLTEQLQHLEASVRKRAFRCASKIGDIMNGPYPG